MRAVVQRVSRAQVLVDDEVVGEVADGLLILIGIHQDDTSGDALWLAEKCSTLRIFRDEDGAMNRSVLDVRGGALVISQFTLYGDSRKGRRPSFIDAARPEKADPLYREFCSYLQDKGVPVSRGIFGADMKVELVNDGPVTLLIDSP